MLAALWVPAVMMRWYKASTRVGGFGCRAGGDLDDVGQAVAAVARIDALGAVADGEGASLCGRCFVSVSARCRVVAQAGFPLQDRDADVLGGAGIDGGFVDHQVARRHDPADGRAGGDQRAEVGALVGVDGRRDGDDVDVAAAQGFGVGGEFELVGLREFVGVNFAGGVAARAQGGDALGVDVETEGATCRPKATASGRPT